MQEAQKKKFEGLNGMFKQFSLKMAKYELMQQPFMEFLAATMVSMTFVYAYFAGIDFPTFSAIGIALYFTIDPIKRVIRMSTDFIKVMPLVDRICAILDYVSTVPEPENPVELCRSLGVNAYHPDRLILAPGDLADLRDAGFAVNVWTVNDMDEAKKLVEDGASGIITDWPEEARAVTDRYLASHS